jgi:hypothetical protein
MCTAMFREGWWWIREGAATRRDVWVRKGWGRTGKPAAHPTQQVQCLREERDEPSSGGRQIHARGGEHAWGGLRSV